ncbi:hypothetical protein cypCar_00001271, partial [Cyprinus carpio]
NDDNENTYVIKRWILLFYRCYSYVGRQGYSQTVSLARNGCLYHSTVQHELLHALGFNHEQTRSDRDNHIQVIWENISDDMKYNFNKINTLNQGTPYDYSSVMQYERYAFSKNGSPTMIPIPNNNAALGTSTEMSQNDIIRINRLYQCCILPKQLCLGSFYRSLDTMFVTKVTFGLLALLFVFSVRAEDMLLRTSLLSCLCLNCCTEPTEASVLPEPDEPKLMDDIAVNERNADPCTSRGCLWPKYSDGKIYVPYVIANHYSSRELEIIKRGLDSFSYSTCIRFFPRSNERDYITIESRSGYET